MPDPGKETINPDDWISGGVGGYEGAGGTGSGLPLQLVVPPQPPLPQPGTGGAGGYEGGPAGLPPPPVVAPPPVAPAPPPALVSAAAPPPGAGPPAPTPDQYVIPPTRPIPEQNIRLTAQDYINQEQAGFKGQEAALQHEADAARQVGTAEAGESQAHAQGLAGEAEEQGRNKEDVQIRQLERDKALKEYENKYADAVEKMAQHQEDPNRLYKTMGTGANIMWLIAQTLGGASAAWNHQSGNQAADALHGMIDRDVRAQQHDYEVLKDKAGMQHTLYGIARSVEDDKDKALQLAQKLGIDQAKTQTQQLVAQAGDPVSRAKAEAVASALDSKKAALGPVEAEQLMKEHKTIPAQAGGAGGARLPSQKEWNDYREKLEKDAAANGRELTPEERDRRAFQFFGANPSGVRMKPGGTPYAPISKEPKAGVGGAAAAQKAREASQSAGEMIRNTERLIQLINKPGARTMAERGEIDQLRTNAALAYPRSQTGSTRINEPELAAGRETFGAPGQWYTGDITGVQTARLRTMVQQARERQKALDAEISGGGGGPAAPEEKTMEDFGGKE